jgi:hypothetical protein
MNPVLPSDRTTEGFAKIIFGTPQPCSFINLIHIKSELTQAGLAHTIQTGFAVVPIFVDLPPNPGDVAALKYYHDVHGNPIYGNDFKPLLVPVPPDAVTTTVAAGVTTSIIIVIIRWSWSSPSSRSPQKALN